MAMPWEAEHLPAILQAWYPGCNGGIAVADVLFGKYNPAGRLPVTFYRSTQDLPDYFDYHMANRTYRYFTGKPLYAFGHGLSYSTFNYGSAAVQASTADADGRFPGARARHQRGPRRTARKWCRCTPAGLGSAAGDPIHSLVAFHRLAIRNGETAACDFSIPADRLRHWDVAKKAYVVDPGKYELQIAAASDDIRQTVAVVVQ